MEGNFTESVANNLTSVLDDPLPIKKTLSKIKPPLLDDMNLDEIYQT